MCNGSKGIVVQPEQIVESTCAYCGVGCGIDITKLGDKATKLKASADHPANFGRLCVKGNNLINTLDVSGRLLAPEVNGERVSWPDAIEKVTNGFADTIKKHGKNSVAFYVSGQLLTEDYYLANKLMKGYIGSGNIDTNSRLCMSSAVAAYKRSFGEDVVPCNYRDLETTQLLLITGSNAAWTHPVLFQRIERARQVNPNMKVVAIDPRATATTESADYHLAIKPGTDAAFFNGLLSYLSLYGGLDEHYIADHTEGIEDALTVAKLWPIERVAAYCDIKLSQLVRVFRLFSQSSSAITLYSMGINQSSSGVDKCQSIINCHLASGKIAKQGCGPFSITGQPNAMGGREVGGLANQLTAHLDIENAEHRDYVRTYWQSPTMATIAGKNAVAMFDAIERGEIKAVWIMATNPLVSLPERDKIKRALTNCPLVVVSDCVTDNDTLAYADIKLPATPWLEKNGTVTNSERCVSRQRSVQPAHGEARHDWQIIANVANAMGYSGFDYQHVSEVFTEFAGLTGVNQPSNRLFDISGLADLSIKEYDNLSPMQWPINQKYPRGCSRVFENGVFSTKSKKAQFFAVEPQLAKLPLTKAFPLSLNSGRLRDHWHSMTRTSLASELTQHTTKPYLYINATELAALDVLENDIVSITSACSGPEPVLVQIKVDSGLGKHQCFMPIHWNQQFASAANISRLYPSIVDEHSGQPECKQVPVVIGKTQFTQFIECHISEALLNNIKLESSLKSAGFWLKNNNAYGLQLSVANEVAIADVLLWCQQLVESNQAMKQSSNVEWLSFGCDSSRYIVLVADKKLLFVCHVALQWPEFESAWLLHLFAKDILDFSDIQALLLGQASSEFSLGKQVCSCFNVAENSIVAEIAAGAKTIEQLGDTLKCGTNCGSCKPELAQLIKRHASNVKGNANSSSSIAIKVVA
jgi:assimilatory nitrate reductase catalytic subunit